MTSTGKAIIEVIGLGKDVPSGTSTLTILHDIDFAVAAGEDRKSVV
jgi:predicted ABC-type transport system involved in lysophospholipase L1 biosynthesis ATPase subunit